MLVREDADEATPDESLDAELPAEAAGEVADDERQSEGDDDPQQVEAVDPADQLVLVEVAAVLPAPLHPLEREEPADVRVRESLDRPQDAVAVTGVR